VLPTPGKSFQPDPHKKNSAAGGKVRPLTKYTRVANIIGFLKVSQWKIVDKKRVYEWRATIFCQKYVCFRAKPNY
jgi:hypothetical protein